jgi:hypothetical protein
MPIHASDTLGAVRLSTTAVSRRTAEAGDIVLFDHLLEDRDLDHIGIIVATAADMMTTAEGNVHNRAGIFDRPPGPNIHGYIRLNGY